MPIYDIYSKRLKKIEGKVPEIYIYDDVPSKFREQVWYIFQDSSNNATINKYCKFVINILCREYELRSIGASSYGYSDYTYILRDFFSSKIEIPCVLDIIELIGRFVEHQENKELIKELNYRFKENGLGYQFEKGNIIRVDSTYIHSEVFKPTLALLWNETFNGACDEYMKAHEHYKSGNNKECINECLKAFESTIKIICKEKGWQYKEYDTAATLIKICKDKRLFPPYMENHLSALEKVLMFGVPTLRNQNTGHGQGAEIKNVDASMARYALNLTGSNIIFLVEQSGIK